MYPALRTYTVPLEGMSQRELWVYVQKSSTFRFGNMPIKNSPFMNWIISCIKLKSHRISYEKVELIQPCPHMPICLGHIILMPIPWYLPVH